MNKQSAWMVSLCLLAISSSNEAFTTLPSSPFTRTRSHQSLHTLYSSFELENRAETPEPSFLSTNDNVGGLDDDNNNMMMRPNKDVIINTSILILAIVIVIERILSVDTGITRGWSPTEVAERIPLDVWRSYNNILSMAPLQTKAVTSATVYTIGDILSQRQEGSDIGSLDRPRILRSLIAGLIGHGPMSHIWYHVSEDFFENTLHLSAWWDFIPKVIVDQTVFGPFWNNSYIILLGIMQLQSPSQIWNDMKRTTLPLIISGLKLWPFVHCITYGLIPVENRLLWVDAVEIVWVMILAGEASGNTLEGGDEVNESDILVALDKENSSLR